MGAPAVDVGAAVGVAGSAVEVGLVTVDVAPGLTVETGLAVAVEDMAVVVPDAIVEVAVEVDEAAVLVGVVSSELQAAKTIRQDKRRK